MSIATARITLDQYHAMAEKGLLRPDSKDYLWHGEIVEVMGQNPPHVNAILNLAECLRAIYPPERWGIRTEMPLAMPDDSEPLPDILIVRGQRPIYYDRHPWPDDVELLVEVSDTTLNRDLGEKLQAYAGAGIPRYWVADIGNRLLLTFWDPDQDAGMYRSSKFLSRGQSADTPNGPIRVDDIFANLP